MGKLSNLAVVYVCGQEGYICFNELGILKGLNSLLHGDKLVFAFEDMHGIAVTEIEKCAQQTPLCYTRRELIETGIYTIYAHQLLCIG